MTSGIGFLKWMLCAHCVRWWRNDLYPTDKHSPVIPALTGGSHQRFMGVYFKIDCRTEPLFRRNGTKCSRFALYQSKAHWRKKKKYWIEWRSFQKQSFNQFMTAEAIEIRGRLIYNKTNANPVNVNNLST